MVNDVDDRTFKTSNTPLAAYLVSLGYPEPIIEYDNHRAFFIFEDIDDKFRRYVHDFEILRAEGNIPAYEEARKKLVKKVKRGLY